MTALRILIVEDDAMIAVLYADTLLSMGYDVCATEATEAGAVAAARACRPDLMLVDERLALGSGVAAVDEILRGGAVPHVFVSGDTLRILTLKPGAVVLQKPFCEAELAHAIDRALAVTH